jgi:hypothetical protein
MDPMIKFAQETLNSFRPSETLEVEMFVSAEDQRAGTGFKEMVANPVANPTITCYNASVVKIYNATNSIALF